MVEDTDGYLERDDGEAGDHDDERERAHHHAETRFLNHLHAHVTNATEASWLALSCSAGELASLGGDHFGHGISWSKEIDVRIGPLLEGDERTWGLLLQGLMHRTVRPNERFVERFRDASPFRDRIVVFRFAGSGSGPTYYGDVRPIVEERLRGVRPVELGAYDSIYVLDMPVAAPGSVPEGVPGVDDEPSVGC